MTNISAVTVYIVFVIFTLSALISILTKRKKLEEENWFIFLAAMVVLWTVTYIIWDLTENPALLKGYYALFFPPIALIPPILFTMTNRFFRVRRQIPNFIVSLLFVIPLLTTILSLTAENHNLIFESFEIINLAPVREVYLKYGIGFWIHTVYCYIITLASISLMIYYLFKIPKYNYLSLVLFASGLFASITGNVFTLLNVFPVSLDPTVIFANISVVFYFSAILNNPKSYFINFSRQWVFEQLEDMILIMDTNDKIIEINENAENWFSFHNISLKNKTFDEILNIFSPKEYHYFENHNPEETGIDYQFEDGKKTYIFYMRKKAIINSKKNIIGYSAVFTDVSQNRYLQEQLEKRAGIDSLTGINNRTSFEKAQKQLDCLSCYPLGIVVYDLNGLKKVNDLNGHSCGDSMLKETAKILETCCPAKGFLARIGGDEFIYLLPNTNEDIIRNVIHTAKEKFGNFSGDRFKLEVAAGYSIKTTEAESFKDKFTEADKLMYENKKLIKSIYEASA